MDCDPEFIAQFAVLRALLPEFCGLPGPGLQNVLPGSFFCLCREFLPLWRGLLFLGVGLENTDQKRGTGKQDIGSSCSSVSIDINMVMENVVAIGLRNCEV